MPSPQQRSFIRNDGQWDSQVLFLARSPGTNVWITDSGVVYDHFVLHSTGSLQEIVEPGSAARSLRRQGDVVRMEFVGGSPGIGTGVELLPGYVNYLKGPNPADWTVNVPTFAEARTERVYNGISARWYFDQGSPRYDLIVQPGANPNQVAMRFIGSKGVSLDQGGLRLETSLGTVRQEGLFAYQKGADGIRQVPCKFVVQGQTVRFDLGSYDRSKPLVIDPLLLSTYLGGDQEDICKDVCLDAQGRTVVTGHTGSSVFPVTAGAYDTTVADFDAFICKFNADGSQQVFCTLVGGTGFDSSESIAVDTSGNYVFGGSTSSADYPTTGGAFDTTMNGAPDCFVSRVSSDGSVLLASTFLGGAGYDDLADLALDKGGRPIAVGFTGSAAFPVTNGSYDTTLSGTYDGFVVRLNAAHTLEEFGTYIGGNSSDNLTQIVLDDSGAIYASGATQSSNFPTTAGAYDTSQNGSLDAVVVKMSANGNSLSFSSFLGGTDFDTAQALAVASTGRVFVTGYSSSVDLPTTVGALQGTSAGFSEAFAASFAPNGASLGFCTYLGGSAVDTGEAISLDSGGYPVIGGTTGSTDFPTTINAFAVARNGTGSDNFVARLSVDGSTLMNGTYFGGTSAENTYSMVLDASGTPLVCGMTDSSDLPLSPGCFQPLYVDNNDGFVSKLTLRPVLISMSAPSTVVGGFSTGVLLTVDHKAVGEDVLIEVETDTPGKVFPPATTKIRNGQSSKTLSLRTETVKVDTPATVTALLDGRMKQISILLKPGGLLSLKASTNTLSAGTFAYGTATLSAPAPDKGREIVLSSSNNAALYVPSTLSMSPGNAVGVFPIYGGPVSTSTPVIVSAKLGVMTKTVIVTVVP